MSDSIDRLAILASSPQDAEGVSAALASVCNCADTYEVQTLKDLKKAVRSIAAASLNGRQITVNLCAPGGRNVECDAALAAAALEQNGMRYTGCRAKTLAYPLDIMFMMLYYAEIPLPPFVIAKKMEDAQSASRQLRVPVSIRSAYTTLDGPSVVVYEPSKLESTMTELLAAHGKLVAWQIGSDGQSCATAVVCGGKLKGLVAGKAACKAAGGSGASGEAWQSITDYCAAFSRYVLYDSGIATLRFNALSEEDEKQNKWCLRDFTLNPCWEEIRGTLHEPCVSRAGVEEVLQELVREVHSKQPEPTFEIRLHDDSRKGYHLCAARSLVKDEIVFADETRSFALVTRPHVESTWDAALKKTFTEYAWPLDSDGHLYAIWEEDPCRWRPINHSCDPNCMFAAPHSLNVIAARDIAAGEDLSIDYAMFCDGTMKPFTCLCGASCCRGTIFPTEEAMKKYGENTWLRAAPPPVKPLV